jgi:SAM-dependent methyltransferase
MLSPARGPADPVRQLFDAKAATWPAKYEPGGRLTGRLTRLTEAIRSQARPGSTVLDLGCATGELARSIAGAGLRVTACDISAQMLRCAADRDPGAQVHWVPLDPGWRRLPFQARSFDAVVAASVLEYVAEPGLVLGEFARVLRPGGLALCTVPDPTHPVRWLEWLVNAAARLPSARAASHRWPRLDGYLSYLEISRQRQPAGWWSATAARAGLLTIGDPAGGPLRLMTFQRPASAGDWP